MTPKYMQGLHLGVSAICGTPRIYKENPKNPNLSDKYINISREEFESAILNYYRHLDRKNLIEILKETIKELESEAQ